MQPRKKRSEGCYKIYSRDIADQIEKELQYPGEIKIDVIRENRVIEYAR